MSTKEIIEKKYKMMLVLVIMLSIVLYFSDSLASFVAYISGMIMIVLSALLGPRKRKYFFLLTCIFAALSLVICFYYMDPWGVVEKFDFLPISAKHRLFIWNFATIKAMLNPFMGYGFASSRYIEVLPSDIIMYKGYSLHPLPLHPHNIVVQLFLETGIIGLIFAVLILKKYLDLIENTTINDSHKNIL
jgi:O-antigen ligase